MTSSTFPLLHLPLLATLLGYRPLADPRKAARKLMEIANSVEPVQDGRIHIELIN